MTHSDPAVRERLKAVLQQKGSLRASTIGELKQMCGMEDVSDHKFKRALQSLHYNPGPVHVNRYNGNRMGIRSFAVTYLGTRTHDEANTGTTTISIDNRYFDLVMDAVMNADSQKVEFTDYAFEDKVLGCVTNAPAVFRVDRDELAQLLAAIDYLHSSGLLAVDRKPVPDQFSGKKVYPAEFAVTIEPV